ncbi:hypothetical protein HaLaN_16829 [Haematococcus lacustris]|uniref:Uncharacterized protein n=1 Tax=Haematococcus lacustris TaxID=44745 RepID=A0A699ZCH6_HAELA|nr:hypothetical protein HaLaN_16829 [Haematococcus lacustris]
MPQAPGWAQQPLVDLACWGYAVCGPRPVIWLVHLTRLAGMHGRAGGAELVHDHQPVRPVTRAGPTRLLHHPAKPLSHRPCLPPTLAEVEKQPLAYLQAISNNHPLPDPSPCSRTRLASPLQGHHIEAPALSDPTKPAPTCHHHLCMGAQPLGWL